MTKAEPQTERTDGGGRRLSMANTVSEGDGAGKAEPVPRWRVVGHME